MKTKVKFHSKKCSENVAIFEIENISTLQDGDYYILPKDEFEKLEKQHTEMYEALKLAKKIIHLQMGKGLVLSNVEYNKMFGLIKEIENES